jgi:DNA-binding MarR family transcriptional regulator
LDEGERALWLAMNGVLTRLPAALDAHLEAECDLSYFEYLFLAMLSEQPTRTLQMSELASVTNASLSRLSHVARRLEGRGLLERVPDDDDRRCTNAVLTSDGAALVQAVAPRHVAEVRRLVFDVLPAGAAPLVAEALAKIFSVVDPNGRTEPGAKPSA